MYERKVIAALVRSRMGRYIDSKFQSETVQVEPRPATEYRGAHVAVLVKHSVPVDNRGIVYNNLVQLFANDRNVAVIRPVRESDQPRRRAA